MHKQLLKLLKLVFLLSFPIFSRQIDAQVTVTPVGTRTQLVSQVGNLTCRLDNIGGATTTIHIFCTVPLGYIKIETTTPRPLAGGSIGGFSDEIGNTMMWVLQQKTRGQISYQITSNGEVMQAGVF